MPGQHGRDALDAGRSAYDRCDWVAAYDCLSAADDESALEAPDLERLAITAQLLGRDEDGLERWEHAHRVALAGGDVALAVRCAFWLSLGYLNRCEGSRGAGWLARASRLLDESGLDCVEHGYVLLPEARRRLVEGEVPTAIRMFADAAAIAVRFGDTDLVALARLGMGQASAYSGDVSTGLSLLDEAMIALTAGEVSPLVIGIVYCGVVEPCHAIFDLRRATEWTAVLTRWCEANADIVAFRGECHVYRAEVMRTQGRWGAALQEAERAHELFGSTSGEPGPGRRVLSDGRGPSIAR